MPTVSLVPEPQFELDDKTTFAAADDASAATARKRVFFILFELEVDR